MLAARSGVRSKFQEKLWQLSDEKEGDTLGLESKQVKAVMSESKRHVVEPDVLKSVIRNHFVQEDLDEKMSHLD